LTLLVEEVNEFHYFLLIANHLRLNSAMLI